MSDPDIFISYNHEDVATAQTYRDALTREGYDVWWDATLRSGETYDEVTEASLRAAKAVVVLWSPRSVTSRWVRSEATIADRNNTLLPVTIEACNRPVMFELTQTADLSHWRGQVDDKAWMAFLDDVERTVRKDAPLRIGVVPDRVPAASGVPVVAVLPLMHRVGDEEIEVLAEDLTEEITRELACNRYFEVIATRRMTKWRGNEIDYGVLGKELHARFLIEGKLQRTGDDFRLTLQLLDAGTSGMVWSQRIDIKTDDVAPSPEKLATTLAAELGVQLIQSEISRAMTKPGPYSAWEHIVRCLALVGNAGSDGTRGAIDEARQAVVAAPDLGLAHAFLATSLESLTTDLGIRLDNSQLEEIRLHAARALQLDGSNPVVARLLVTPYATLGDCEGAMRLARRGVELAPHYPLSHFMLGMGFVILGRPFDAIAAFLQQDRLTSRDTSRYTGLTWLGICYLLEGRGDEAETVIDRALALNPGYHTALKWKALIAAGLGKEKAALATIRLLRATEPTMSIDQHVHQIAWMTNLADRTAGHIVTLRRLWDATSGEPTSE